MAAHPVAPPLLCWLPQHCAAATLKQYRSSTNTTATSFILPESVSAMLCSMIVDAEFHPISWIIRQRFNYSTLVCKRCTGRTKSKRSSSTSQHRYALFEAFFASSSGAAWCKEAMHCVCTRVDLLLPSLHAHTRCAPQARDMQSP